ncbi:hypothetical protein ACU8OH_31800 (plasmid) [Rhizobium leguminosarum]
MWKVDEQADRKAPVKTTDLGPLDLSQAKRAQCDKEVKPEGMAVLTSHTEGSAMFIDWPYFPTECATADL